MMSKLGPELKELVRELVLEGKKNSKINKKALQEFVNFEEPEEFQEKKIKKVEKDRLLMNFEKSFKKMQGTIENESHLTSDNEDY